MRFSAFLVAAVAGSGVLAGPLARREMTTETVTETVLTTTTVPPGGAATSEAQDSAATSVAEETETPEATSSPAAESSTEEEPATSTAEESSESTANSDSGDSLATVAVTHHNIHRANHSAPDLGWDSEIAGYAAITAATCTFAHDTATGGGNYGQNIAMWASSGDVRETGADVFLGRTITEMWYNGEIDLYPSSNYGSDDPDMSNFHGWGHYSQVIWVETTGVGCAVQYCEPGTMVDGMGAFFSVCNYSPPGNVGGGFADNVLAPQGLDTYHAD